MRIATSSLYDQQIAAIDNLVAQQAQYGNTLSTGKQLNQPSDNPTQIAQDLGLHTAISEENQTSTNIQNATAEMTTVDGSLSSLTNILQSARSLAVQGATDALSPAQQRSLASQVDGLLQEAIGLANTQYGGTYVFAGTAAPSSPPVSGNGQPVSSVTFTGNFEAQQQRFTNGQSTTTSVTLQQAFNYGATDGSPDVFQTLVNLRDTLANGSIVDQSGAQLNKAGTVITPTTQLNSPSLRTALVPDSAGKISIQIASAAAPNGVTLTFGPTSTVANVVSAINGSGTGVTATFDAQTQRISLAAAQPFQIADVPSPGASTSSNLVEALSVAPQADMVNNLSTQIGAIDHVLNVVTTTRAQLGGNIQTLGALGTTTSSQVANDTAVQSSIEDADIAKVVSQFSQTQTALQAAYATTSRLEGKTLIDYLP